MSRCINAEPSAFSWAWAVSSRNATDNGFLSVTVTDFLQSNAYLMSKYKFKVRQSLFTRLVGRNQPKELTPYPTACGARGFGMRLPTPPAPLTPYYRISSLLSVE